MMLMENDYSKITLEYLYEVAMNLSVAYDKQRDPQFIKADKFINYCSEFSIEALENMLDDGWYDLSTEEMPVFHTGKKGFIEFMKLYKEDR